MKSTALLSLGVLLSCLTTAQNEIPNAGFENWEEETIVFTAFEDPVGWGTSNSTTASFGIVTTTKVSDPQFVHSGSHALRLETEYLSVLDLPIQGGVATAELDIDLINQSVSPIGGVQFNLRPNVLRGWYHYLPANVDSARFGMLLQRWNPETGTSDTIAVALFETIDETEGYTFFEVPFEYQSELDPDTMLLGILCSKVENPGIGSVLYADDLSLGYLSTGLDASIELDLKLFPNPTGGSFSVQCNQMGQLSVFDSQGRVLKSVQIEPGLNAFNFDDFPPGIYPTLFESSSNQSIHRTKVAVLR